VLTVCTGLRGAWAKHKWAKHQNSAAQRMQRTSATTKPSEMHREIHWGMPSALPGPEVCDIHEMHRKIHWGMPSALPGPEVCDIHSPAAQPTLLWYRSRGCRLGLCILLDRAILQGGGDMYTPLPVRYTLRASGVSYREADTYL
jgi:hypothetical protein